jgi:hypothetical protein
MPKGSASDLESGIIVVDTIFAALPIMAPI